MSDYTQSNVAGLVAAVSALTKIQNEIGDEDAARAGAAPRIVWIPQPIEDEPIVRQPADGHAFGVEAQSFNVSIRGSSFTAAEALRWSLKAALRSLFGSDAYPVQFKGARPSGDHVTSTDYTWIQKIVLRVPIYDKVWAHSTLPNLGQRNGTVTADGTTTEPLP